MKNPLIDKEFLKNLDERQYKELYAKIIALDFDNNPVEEIQGMITGGSISISGGSSVQRTCSLNMTTHISNFYKDNKPTENRSLSRNNVKIHEYYWGLKTKFKLSIGIRNDFEPMYPDIIWFPQGDYVISSFGTSQDVGSYSISIQGNDKMSLLNGTAGGTITALTVDFGKIDEIDSAGNITTKDLLLKDIIREAVHEYAKEPFHNIIINDLDDVGVELLEYRGRNPMYMIVNNETDIVSNITDNGSQKGYFRSDTGEEVALQDLKDHEYDHRISIDMAMDDLVEPLKLQVKDNKGQLTGNYSIIKVEYGDVVGYRVTDLTYAGDLILDVGDTVTSMLDKIVDMLGAFEYFYNTAGQFVFQRKKTYVQTSFNNLTKDGGGEIIATNAAETSSFVYSFEGGKLISSFSNSPDYNNLKNDYSIWGVRESVDGNELPVHLRCAIDLKPTEYTTISVSQDEADIYKEQWDVLGASAQTSITYTTEDVTGDNVRGNLDWREIIYQMAMDHSRWNHLDGFTAKVALANPWRQIETVLPDGTKTIIEKVGYPDGYTGYEQYYTDLKGFWRQLYNPDYEGSYKIAYVTRSSYEDKPTDFYWYQQCQSNEAFEAGRKYFIDTVSTGYSYQKHLTKEQYDNYPENYFYIVQGTSDTHEVEVKYTSTNTIIFDKTIKHYTKDSSGNIVKKDGAIVYHTFDTEEEFQTKLSSVDLYHKETQLVVPYNVDRKYYRFEDGEYNTDTHWSYQIAEAPELLNFWFDFLDTEGELSKYSVQNVGIRAKAENNADVKAIYFREIPDVIFYDEKTTDEELEEQKKMKQGFTFIRLPQIMENLFTISGQGQSAKDMLDNMLYNYTYCTESISISGIPVFYLEPNTRIFVRDDQSGINGEYIVESISLPLGHGGSMSISAIKAVENMY